MSAAMNPGLFGALKPQAPDALLSLIGLYRADPRPDKIDLGVGVYRDLNGVTPVLQAVKAAESRLLSEQTTKAYLGPEGDLGFLDLINPIIFGGAGRAGVPARVRRTGPRRTLQLHRLPAAQGTALVAR